MGCDGGTIPRRDELVRMKKKPEQKDKDAERAFKWRSCALSQQPLQEPIVSCGLGRLYSKSSVLETLLDKESKPESISHIKNMKDIRDLKLVKNPAYIAADRLEGAVDEGSSPYICPISGLEMRGKFRFIYLWSCGCVMAERALKEVKQNMCHMCQQPFTDNDVIILNGTDEDIELLKTKMATRVASRKGSKKSKDSKKCETVVKAQVTTETTDSQNETKIIKDSGKDKTTKNTEAQINTDAVKIEDNQLQSKDRLTAQAISSSSNNIEFVSQSTPSCSNKDSEPTAGSSSLNKQEIEPHAGSSCNKKEIERQAGSSKKEFETIPLSLPKYNPNKQARGHFGSSKRALSNDLVQDPSYKKTKKDYSVASDPQSSEVFKSLFTSHKSEQEQTRAHWVTYNPFYN